MEVDGNSLEFRREFPRIVYPSHASRSYIAPEKDKGAGKDFLKYGTVGEREREGERGRATKVS